MTYDVLARVVLMISLITLARGDFKLYTVDAEADSSTATLSVTCVSPGVVSFSPNIDYTLSVPTPTTDSFSPSQFSITASLTNAVNGNSAPTVNIGPDGGGTRMTLYHAAPFIKIGGVQCSSTTSARLEVHGDGADDENFDVAVQDQGSTSYQAGNRVDNTTSASPAVLWGGGGSLQGSTLSDGSDADTYTNGEIAFGGTGAASAGGFKLFTVLQYLEANPTNHGETLTWVFTPN